MQRDRGQPQFLKADLLDVVFSTVLLVVGLAVWFGLGHVLTGAVILLSSVGMNLRMAVRHMKARRATSG